MKINHSKIYDNLEIETFLTYRQFLE